MVDQKRRGHRRNSSSASYTHQDKEFHCWTSLRTIFGIMVPCCRGSNGASTNIGSSTNKLINNVSMMGTSQGASTSSSVVTGTIFGQRRGRVNFCMQEDPASPPLLLLEFAIPTHLLVKEMESGLLRITLECDKTKGMSRDPHYIDDLHIAAPLPLFAEPVWSMYCNGRKVGFAMNRTVKSDSDPAISSLMSLMQSVTSGAGVIPCQSNSKKNSLVGTHDRMSSGDKDDTRSPRFDSEGSIEQEDNGVEDDLCSGLSVEKPSLEQDELIYMRANYERVVGSPDSEAFHMINPDGSQCQELSIFLTRS